MYYIIQHNTIHVKNFIFRKKTNILMIKITGFMVVAFLVIESTIVRFFGFWCLLWEPIQFLIDPYYQVATIILDDIHI